MQNWFNVRIAYERRCDDGSIAKVKENYLVDALSFTESEERITKEMQPYVSGDFLIEKVTRARISQLILSQSADRYYRCKVMLISLDKKKGVEKRTASAVLVQANTLQEAVEIIEAKMRGTLSDWELVSVTETNIMDVFLYRAE